MNEHAYARALRCACTRAQALALAHPGHPMACLECGSVLTAPERPAGVTPSPAPAEATGRPDGATAGPWNAQRELGALARFPGVRAIALEPVRGRDLALDNPAQAIADAIAHDDQRAMMERAHVRLGMMLRHADRDMGERYAGIVHYTHVVRGPELRHPSPAEAVAAIFGRDIERGAYRKWMDTAEGFRQLKPGARDALLARAYGNRLIGVSVAAYETDQWAPVVPRRTGWRERFYDRVAAGVASLKAKIKDAA